MTCAHCVVAVTAEFDNLSGVSGVEVDLVPGGESRVRVTSAAPLPVERVRHAVQEAAYTLSASSS